MKKLGKLNLMKEKILNHEELVSFRGGSGDCTGGKKKYSCECTDSVGSWEGCYDSQTAAEARAKYNCASQEATCTIVP